MPVGPLGRGAGGRGAGSSRGFKTGTDAVFLLDANAGYAADATGMYMYMYMYMYVNTASASASVSVSESV